MPTTAGEVKARAAALGFVACGITDTAPTPHADRLDAWLAMGYAGTMRYLHRQARRRKDPRLIVPDALSVVVVLDNYYSGPEASREPPKVARYALGEDYHRVTKDRVSQLAEFLSHSGAQVARVYTDAGPVPERELAQRAGLGWIGKNTMLIRPGVGSFFFIGSIFTDLALEPDAPFEADHCGTCTRCLDACPTGAITAPYQLDARRCISYLTIELKGSIPEEFRPLIGDRIYGCDECLEVCPWNRFAQTSRETQFASGPREDMADLLALTPAGFKERFRGSPIFRIKRRGLLRNVCVALGNVGTTADLPALERAAQDEEPLIREHAAWAIRQIQHRFL
jgi:epoxyqueuosine reductase